MHDTNHLSAFVDEWATHCIVGYGVGEDVVIVSFLKLLNACDILLLERWLLDRIRNEPNLAARRWFCCCNVGSRGITQYPELSHIVKFIGTEDGIHVQRLSAGIHDGSLYSTDKRFEGTDSRSLVINKYTLCRRDDVTILVEGGECKYALSGFLYRAWLSEEGWCTQHQSHQYHIYSFHILNNSLALARAACVMSLPLSIWAISSMRSWLLSSFMCEMVPFSVSSFNTL